MRRLDMEQVANINSYAEKQNQQKMVLAKRKLETLVSQKLNINKQIIKTEQLIRRLEK